MAIMMKVVLVQTYKCVQCGREGHAEIDLQAIFETEGFDQIYKRYKNRNLGRPKVVSKANGVPTPPVEKVEGTKFVWPRGRFRQKIGESKAEFKDRIEAMKTKQVGA